MSDIDIIRRIAERGLKMAQKRNDEYIDIFQHMVDEASRIPSENKWKPIDSAPIDELIDLYVTSSVIDRGWRVIECIWDDERGVFMESDGGVITGKITHWMPIPQLPGANDEQ